MFLPSSKLSWELKQELRKGQGARVGLLFDLALPASTLRYAWGAIAVPGLAQYDAAVLEVGSLERAASDDSGGTPTAEQTLTIDDASLAFSRAVEGPQGHLVKGSAVTQTLASPNVPRAQWATVFAGEIAGYKLAGKRRWDLTLRPRDLPLRKKCPRPVILQADWPNADTSVYAQYGPVIYGDHDSAATTATGAVPLVYVGKVASKHEYLVQWGRSLAVPRVYTAGVLQTSGYTVSYPTRGGRVCTLVTFTASQGTAAVTADVQGLDSNGDGTGTLIQTPTDVIRHFLTNWVYNDWKSGAWFPESAAVIDAASFDSTAATLARNAAKCAKRIFGPEQQTASAFLDEWVQTWQTRLFWTLSGSIGCRLEDFAQMVPYRDEVCGWIRHDRTPFLNEPSFAPAWDSELDRVNVDFHYQAAAGKYLYSLEVSDPSLPVEAPDSLQLPWSAASA